MTLTTRRVASTETIHKIWDAIVYLRQQKQTPNIDRIEKYIKRKHGTMMTSDELKEQIRCAVKDNLIDIKEKNKKGGKGSRVDGVEKDTYRVPEMEVEKDGHDWYCYGCHKWGEVISCTTCHRVYHIVDCWKGSPSTDKPVCHICKMVKVKETIKINLDDLNLLLGYVCIRMKEVHLKSDWAKTIPSSEEMWRYNLLIYEKMDLDLMDDKTENNEYKSLAEFQVDAQTLVHNIVIYHGIHSGFADTARQMLRDICTNLNEIKLCKDCYRFSNEKKKKFWFCEPCDPPHELVYAKLKGHSYWPAKVINIQKEKNVYDVRFFGSDHERADIERDHIKPITVNFQQIQPKRSSTLNKALEELKRHQQLLGQVPEVKKTPTRQQQKRKSRSSSESSSRSNSRSTKSSSDEEGSENEAEDGSSSQDEAPTSSSPKVPRFKDAPTPEDHNVVSSSCQESSPCAKVTVSTQTPKKLLASLIPKPQKQEEKPPVPCTCDEKYSKMFKDYKEELDAEKKEDKEKSLRELAERLRTDFEEEKQRVVALAVEKVKQEFEEVKTKFEKDLQDAHELQVTETIERHRGEMSEIKKKQWCYNCEAEAIYHCCWNTSYCSVDCQQVHWHKEHKRTCRRKR